MATPLVDTAQATADAWPSGHRIGSFELQEAVSRGASGIVYRAWDHGLSLPVAIKEHFPASIARRRADGELAPALPGASAAFESSLQAFILGTRALARCDHPALVRVLHLHTAHGTAYRVMPWVEGDALRTLRQAMSRPPDEAAVRALLEDLLGALEALHRIGLAHGGVHPSQILLRQGDRAILLGPCAVAEAGGTSAPSNDLRALAEVARFCISGMLPTADTASAEPTADIVERLFFDDPTVRYGQEFMRVLDASVSRDGAQRPRSAAQFLERLREAARVDAGGPASDGSAPARAGPPGHQGPDHAAAADRAIRSLMEVMEAMPARGADDSLRLRAERPPSDQLSQPESTALHSLPQRRREKLGAGVYAVLLAVVGFGAWQWLYKPVPTETAPAVSVAAAPASPVPPAPAPLIAAAPPPPDLPAMVEAVAQRAETERAPPIEAATVGRQPAPIEALAARATAAGSPREACGERTQFSLYRCMQQQCARSAWTNHPQCLRLRATDTVE